MAAQRRDPRLDAKRLAELLVDPALRPSLEIRRLGWLVSGLEAAAATPVRSHALRRIRELRNRARKERAADLLALLEATLKPSVIAPPWLNAAGENCVFCGEKGVRYLRKASILGRPLVCEEHSKSPRRAHALRIIRVALLDPPDELLAVIFGDDSFLRHAWEMEGYKNPREGWNHTFACEPLATSADVLALWQRCTAGGSSITPRAWEVVTSLASSRDAEASVRNGRQGGGRPRNRRQEKEIARLAKLGLTQAAIAARLGTDQSQVSRVLRRLRAPS